MTETTDITFKPEAPATPLEAQTVRTEADPRNRPTRPGLAMADPAGPLPLLADVEAWARGAERSLAGLFEGMGPARLDALLRTVSREGLAPAPRQGGERTGLDDLTFNRLPEVGWLRAHYKNQALSRRRIADLAVGWRAMEGLRPAEWTVADLFALVRRFLARGEAIDWTDFLTAVRDVWRDPELPQGRQQYEALGRILVMIRRELGG